MSEGPAPLSRLTAELSQLPGIGRRTAQRLAFHILRSDDAAVRSLSEAIIEVKEKVGLCEICFNLAEGPQCRICLLYTSPSPRDGLLSRMPSSA